MVVVRRVRSERSWAGFRLQVCLVAGLSVAGASGCGKVAAYQRGKLAHPTMRADDAASPGQEHVYAIHEGAVGGTVGVASGCGCN